MVQETNYDSYVDTSTSSETDVLGSQSTPLGKEQDRSLTGWSETRNDTCEVCKQVAYKHLVNTVHDTTHDPLLPLLFSVRNRSTSKTRGGTELRERVVSGLL